MEFLRVTFVSLVVQALIVNPVSVSGWWITGYDHGYNDHGCKESGKYEDNTRRYIQNEMSSIMDEVKTKRETIVITKHGRPVAKLVPVDTRVDEIFGFFSGKGSDHRRRRFPGVVPGRVGQASMSNLR